MAAAVTNLRRALPVVLLLLAACGGRDETQDSPADASPPDVDASIPDGDGGAIDASADISDAGALEDAEAGSDACVGCVCVPGDSADCYSGPDFTVGVGTCTVGQRTCTELGQWSECAGEVLPATEDCGTPFDDDCDGEVNEDPSCVCTPGTTASCYGGAPQTSGVGVCKSGTQTCDPSGIGWGPCEGQVIPKMEDCPSLDDEDCDGQVNEEGLNCVCKPGTQEACYTGPPGTLDVGGACSEGYAICAADGMSYGPCIGEVLPSPEDCDVSSMDEDCDGQDNEDGPSCICVPNEFSGSCYTGPQGTSGVGICKPGQLFCEWSGLEFDDWCYDEVLPALENCAAPADEDCDGTVAPACVTTAWTNTLPLVSTIRIDTRDADVWLAGTAKQPTDFGGGTLPSGTQEDAWIARFGAAGNHIFSRRYPGAGSAGVQGLAVGPDSEAVLVGWCIGATPFDSLNFDCTSDGKAFVVKLDASGNVVWAKTFGADGDFHAATGVDVDPFGNVIVAGHHHATIDFGGAPLASAATGSTFIAKLNPNGGHVFSKSFAHSKTQWYWSANVAALSGGDVILAGQTVGTLDLGGGQLGSINPTLTYAARFSSQGVHAWSKGWNASLSQMRVTSTDAIVLSGYHGGLMDFGPTPLLGGGWFIGELTSAGGDTWSADLALTSSSVQFDMRALAVRTGSPVIIGGDGSAANFGYGKLTEGYLVGVDLTGKPLWQYEDQRVVWDAAYDAQGHLYAAGQDFLWKIQP